MLPLRWTPLLVLLLAPLPRAAFGQGDPASMGADSCAEALPRREQFRQLGVAAWHAAGHKGRGLKVAILDSGFSGYHSQLGKALPAKVIARSFRKDGNLEAKDSQHGILCGEVIHALAPDAELLFANWEPSHPGSFLEAARWAVRQGAQVLSCSIIMPTWSDGEGGGLVHAELSRLLNNGKQGGGVLFFACAGNTADRHWSGAFHDGGRGYHSWDQGIDNSLLPWGDGRVSVEMCASADADLMLLVHDAASGRDLQSCRLQHGDPCTAVVRFSPLPGHSYSIRVHSSNADTRAHFHLFVLGGSLRQTHAGSSIPFPGDGPEVVTVGAVEGDGHRATYSSCGPNSASPKPDLVALVPFESRFRTRPFGGTSAATPQAAGLAAVMWSAHPEWKAAQVRRAMQEAARDLGPRGHDWETGHGLARLPALRNDE